MKDIIELLGGQMLSYENLGMLKSLGTILAIIQIGIVLITVFYVYFDLKNKNESPWMWCLAVLIIPYHIGFLAYLILIAIDKIKNKELEIEQNYENKSLKSAFKITIVSLVIIVILALVSYKVLEAKAEDRMERIFENELEVSNDEYVNSSATVTIAEKKENENKNFKIIQGKNKINGIIYGEKESLEREVWFQKDGQAKFEINANLESGNIKTEIQDYEGNQIWDGKSKQESTTIDVEAHKIYKLVIKLEDKPKGNFEIEWNQDI